MSTTSSLAAPDGAPSPAPAAAAIAAAAAAAAPLPGAAAATVRAASPLRRRSEATSEPAGAHVKNKIGHLRNGP